MKGRGMVSFGAKYRQSAVREIRRFHRIDVKRFLRSGTLGGERVI